MEKYAITPGDFLKNAGIVGLKYILIAQRRRKVLTLAYRKTVRRCG